MTFIVALRGGTRDGETTTVEEGITRLLTPSSAPGLLDVYTASDERVSVPGNSEPAVVFVHTGQESASDTAPELLHQPSD